MTMIRWRRFTVGCFIQTPVKYIFSESLRIVNYEGVFITIKKGIILAPVSSFRFLKRKTRKQREGNPRDTDYVKIGLLILPLQTAKAPRT